MKRRFILLTAVLCVISLTTGVLASGLIKDITAELRKDFVVKIDGEVKEFKNAQGEKVYPILYEGTTYLPIRAIGEAFDKVVYWYEDDKRVELKDTTVTDADVVVSGEARTINVKTDSTEFIGEEKAKAVALEKAGFTAEEVRFDKTELDEDDGIWQYEIEFETGRVEYEVNIGAVNGAILKWEVDNNVYGKKKDDKAVVAEKPVEENKSSKASEAEITVEKAKEIALAKAGISAEGTVFEKAELDKDDGKLQYELEFKKDGIEYEAEIDAVSGNIIGWETDRDD